MVKRVEMLRATDGTIFEYKNAADRYQRGLNIGMEIDNNKKFCDETKSYIKKNWDELKKFVRNAKGSLPYGEPKGQYTPREQKTDDISAVKIYRTQDGMLFDRRIYAIEYERGIKLGQAIDRLKAPKKVKDDLKNHWKIIRGIIREAGNVVPYEKVEDNHKIAK